MKPESVFYRKLVPILFVINKTLGSSENSLYHVFGNIRWVLGGTSRGRMEGGRVGEKIVKVVRGIRVVGLSNRF